MLVYLAQNMLMYSSVVPHEHCVLVFPIHLLMQDLTPCQARKIWVCNDCISAGRRQLLMLPEVVTGRQ